MLIGSDVSALFPSLTRDRTAKAVRRQTEKAGIQWENIDSKWLRLYIHLNRHMVTDIKEVENLLPKKRKGKRGAKPGIGSFECQRRYVTDNYKKGDKLVQIWPDIEPNARQMNSLIAIMLEITADYGLQTILLLDINLVEVLSPFYLYCNVFLLNNIIQSKYMRDPPLKSRNLHCNLVITGDVN